MTDDRPRSAAKPITIQTLELAHAHIAPDNLGLGPKIVLISGVDSPSELLDQLNAEAAKYGATVVVSPASPDTPNTVELKYPPRQSTVSSSTEDGPSRPSTVSGQSAGNRNWLHGDDQPWRHRKTR